MNNDPWLDDQVRAAYEQVVLPKRTLQRLKKQAQRRDPPSRVWIAALLMAAALAVAIVAAWPEPATVAPTPSPGVPVPMPLPPRQEPPMPEQMVRVIVLGAFSDVLIDERDTRPVNATIEVPAGEHTFRGRMDGQVGEPVQVVVVPDLGGGVQRITLPDLEHLASPSTLEPREMVPVVIVGEGSQVSVDSTDTRPTNVVFELPEGMHRFVLEPEGGKRGRTRFARVSAQPGGVPQEIRVEWRLNLEEIGDMSSQNATPPTDPQTHTGLPSVEGLWVGSTRSGRSFKLTVLSQSGDRFEGSAEMQIENGRFESVAVSGRVDASGTLSLQGDSWRCEAQLTGRKVSGTCKKGQTTESFTAYGGM
jgi:hypothetical protein